MRRTIANARGVLEALTPTLTVAQADAFRGLLDEAESGVRDVMDKRIRDHEATATERLEAAHRELIEVRTTIETLTGEGAKGLHTADAYNVQANELRHRYERAEQLLGEIAREVEALAEMEDDPLGHYDELATRLPTFMREFPW